MALADIYELKDEMFVNGQSMLNIYHVERASPLVSAADINNAFTADILPGVLSLQHPATQHTGLTCMSLGNPIDFDILPYAPPIIGTRLGSEALASYAAVGLRFPRERLDMRHGRKRYFGGLEADAQGDEWTGAFQTEAQGVANDLIATWTSGQEAGVPVCNFVIVKRIKYTTPGGGTAWRLPNSDAELVFYRPLTALVEKTVRTQGTRKIY